jgi:leader peptidase (prepilin peptidase) / N-methyltransferase
VAVTVFFVVYFFIVGLVLGSFFNVVGLRVPKQESIIHPRSHCTICNRNLSPVELVPFFSYIFQAGKCKGCHTKISLIYPIMELVTAFLFAISFYKFGWSPELVISISLSSLLVIITISDMKYMIIPNKILIFFTGVFVVLRIFFPLEPWWDTLLGGIIGFLLLFLIAVVSKGGMGGGDIKLFAVLGILLGWKEVLLAFFFATFLGATIGIILLITGKVARKQKIPFAPFIAGGALLVYFFGQSFIKWYFQF